MQYNMENIYNQVRFQEAEGEMPEQRERLQAYISDDIINLITYRQNTGM